MDIFARKDFDEKWMYTELALNFIQKQYMREKNTFSFHFS